MYLRGNLYIADKGKHFVLTKKGKTECASYSDKTIGEPVSEYDTEAFVNEIQKGYLEEVDIPNWVVKEGFEVVYDHNSHTIHAGNAVVFPEREIAEKYMKNYQSYPWMHEKLYIRDAIYEGRSLKECREHDGKKVYNNDWFYGTSALDIGDLVEEVIIDDLRDLLPPACMRSDCFQIGEPANHKEDPDGNFRATYATFKKIDPDIWQYCGECFRGENVMH